MTSDDKSGKGLMNGPWKVLHRESKYKNRFSLEVFEDQVLRPDGKEGIFGWVQIGDGVSVLPIDKQGYVYLGKEFQYGLGTECLEPISGGISPGESPEAAARRELEEEIGIKAANMKYLGEFNPLSGRIKSHQHLYIATGLDFGQSKLESTENIRMVKMSLDEAVSLVKANKIKDVQNSLLILMAQDYVKDIKDI